MMETAETLGLNPGLRFFLPLVYPLSVVVRLPESKGVGGDGEEEMEGLAFAGLGPTLGQAGVGAPEKPVELGERDMRERY